MTKLKEIMQTLNQTFTSVEIQDSKMKNQVVGTSSGQETKS